MKNTFVLIIIIFCFLSLSSAQNRLTIESGIDVSVYSKSGLLKNVDNIRPAFVLGVSYSFIRFGDFEIGAGLLFKPGVSFDEFYDSYATPTSVRAFPIYSDSGAFRERETYYNLDMPFTISFAVEISNELKILFSVEDHINVISDINRSYFNRDNPIANGKWDEHKFFSSYCNPSLGMALHINESFRIKLYGKLREFPRRHKSIGILAGVTL